MLLSNFEDFTVKPALSNLTMNSFQLRLPLIYAALKRVQK